MIANIEKISGWKKDQWKITRAGNYAHFLAKNQYDDNVKVFLTDSGGRGDNWKIKVGEGTGIGESENVAGSHASFDDKDTAILKAAEFMKKNPKVQWRGNEFPKLVDENNDRVERI